MQWRKTRRLLNIPVNSGLLATSRNSGRTPRTSSCMAGNPILVEVSENQDLTTAAANRRAKFILGFAHQLGQFRYIRRDPSCLIFGERLAAEGRPGAQPKKGPGRPAKYDLRDCDERCFLRAPRESCSDARVSTGAYRRRPLLPTSCSTTRCIPITRALLDAVPVPIRASRPAADSDR